MKCDSKAIRADRVLMVKTENAIEDGAFSLPLEIGEKKHTLVPAGRFHSPGSASLQADPAAFGGSAWVNRTPPHAPALPIQIFASMILVPGNALPLAIPGVLYWMNNII